MPATELLDEVIAAHGGIERYRSAEEIVVRIASGGFAFVSRFQRGALRSFEGRVSTAGPRTVISPYPREGQRGIFEPDAVRIESEQGEVIAERENPRAAFRSLRHNIWWDSLDLLHFAGYALWGYLSTPFMFLRPGFELKELEPWREDGERWRRLGVTFPPDIPNHSREQVFYFDDAGMLRRLDYTAEVFGSWAKAAHLCFDHKEFGGLVVPTRRRVYPRKRNNRPRPRPTLVWIDISDVQLVPRTTGRVES